MLATKAQVNKLIYWLSTADQPSNGLYQTTEAPTNSHCNLIAEQCRLNG